jgi:ribose transport system ATP-binding protein
MTVEMAAAAEAAANPLLRISGLRKEFPGVIALDGVDFELARGEIHALLGANGAGKSTLIKITSGLYQADRGEIHFEGMNVRLHDTQAARELGISVIYQDLALVPHLSIAENLFLGRELVTRTGFVDWQRTHLEARHLLDRIGFEIDTRTRVSGLSMGQRQLVEIARALGTEAKLLILDEPTASLSRGEAERLFALIRRLACAGVGIIYVSHRLDEIASLVDRVTVLRDGKSVGTFPVEALDRSKVVALITGQERAGSKASLREIRKTGEPLLELEQLGRDGEFSDVTLTIRRGEIVVLTGLVGAGRTELLETTFGARIADRGTLRVRGKTVQFTSPSDAIRSDIALIPEDRRGKGLATIMPVVGNMTLASLGRFVRGMLLDRRTELTHVRGMIRELSIRTPSPLQPAGLLSGGNQQKLVLAKWLSTEAQIFLLDEPTQGVDVGAKEEIYQLIRGIAAAGKAVLVVSSDLEEVIEIADRVLAMRQGRIVGEFINEKLDPHAIMDAITHGRAA